MEYLNSLLQPWRRVPRAEFTLALTVLSLPGLLLMLGGFITSGATFIGPLLDLGNTASSIQAGNPQALFDLAQPAATPSAPTPVAPLDTAALLNNLFLLLLTPFIRGRWLDIGYSAKAATILALLVQLSILNGALVAIRQAPVLPYAWALAALTMVGYLWLTLRAGKPRKSVHERAFRVTKSADDDFPAF